MTRAAISRLSGSQRLLPLLGPLMLWPAAVNGGAFFFNDTGSYVRGPDALVARVTGVSTMWTTTDATSRRSDDTPANAGESTQRVISTSSGSDIQAGDKPVLVGRSVYYGFLLYLGALTGSFWYSILFQAILVGAVVVGLVRHFIDPARARVFALTVLGAFVLLAITPLPYFTSFLMPDVFTGLGLLAVAALIAGWSRENRAGRTGWAAVATMAALVHSSNVLMLLALALLGVTAAAVLRRRELLAPAAVIAATASIGIVAEISFVAVVGWTTGMSPIRPPFITARLTADGPGTKYLHRACPQARFLLCRYRDRLPLHSDNFLWATSPTNGVFRTLSFDGQRALAREQTRFVIAVATALPFKTFKSSVRAATEQLLAADLIDFNYPVEQRKYFASRLPSATMGHLRTTAAFATTMPVEPIEMLIWPLTLLSLAMLLGVAISRTPAITGYWLIVVAGWLANDIICGALSTPHSRYQARMLWTLPLIAMLVLICKLASRPSPTRNRPPARAASSR